MSHNYAIINEGETIYHMIPIEVKKEDEKYRFSINWNTLKTVCGKDVKYAEFIGDIEEHRDNICIDCVTEDQSV